MELYRYEMEQVVKFAEQLLAECPPDEALKRWMHRLAEYSMTKAGLATAISKVANGRGCDGSIGYAPVIAAAQLLIDANERAGTLRAGVTTDNFFQATAGIWQMDFRSDWRPQVAWLIDFVMQGLRGSATVPTVSL